MIHPSNRLNNARSFEPSSMGGREAFAVRCAAGEGNRSGEVARNAPGAGGMLNGALHPSDCPGGERGLRLQTVIGGRTRSLWRASRSRGRESSQWNRPERAGRGWYVRWCAASVQLPGRRARFALQAVLNGRTRSLIVRRAAGKEDHRSGTARSAPGASGALHPSDCPGGEHGLRFRPSLVDGRGAFAVRRAAGKENRRSGTARNAPGAGGM